MKTRAQDGKLEKQIAEIEQFWATDAPEKYQGWNWMKMPDNALAEVDSYHRMATLELNANQVEWDSPLTKLGVAGAIDGHSHLEGYPETPGLVEELKAIMDGSGIENIVTLPLYKFWDEQKQEIEAWNNGPLAGRVICFAGFDWQLDDPGFVEKACKHLDEVKAMGARGIKVHKNVGLSIKSNGKVATLGDTRYKEVFAHAGTLDMPILIHYGDPYSFFFPLEGNDRTRELSCFPDWHWYPEHGEKEYWKNHEAFFRLVEETRGTNYITAHLANYPWEKMDEFARLLESEPNLYADTSGRLGEIGKGKALDGTHYHRAAETRELLTRCQDKILWGTDILPTGNLYKLWSYFLRTDATDIDYTWSTFYTGQGDWLVDCLNLEQPLLEKFCRGVAAGLLGLDK